MSSSPDSPSTDTVIYDNAERGRGGADDIYMQEAHPGNIVFSPNNTFEKPVGSPTFYGPIPVYENRFSEQVGSNAEHATAEIGELVGSDPQFSTSGMGEPAGDGPQFQIGEQVGGGGTEGFSHYSLRCNIPLTPKAQKCHETRNAAQYRNGTAPDSPSPNFQHNFFDGLDDETIASLACDRTSNFTVSPDLPNDTSAVEGDEVPPRSLLEEFYMEGEFLPIQLPPGPPLAASTPTATATSSATSDTASPNPPPADATPKIANAVPMTQPANKKVKSATSGQAATPPTAVQGADEILTAQSAKAKSKSAVDACIDSPTPKSKPAADVRTPKSKPATDARTDDPTVISDASRPKSANASPSVGRLGANKLNRCSNNFGLIHKLFVDTAEFVDRPLEVVHGWFFSGFKGTRSTNWWNMYQVYFRNHREEELKRCELEDGTDADCWPSFQEEYGPNLESYLRAALDLDRVLTQKETLQQRSRSFTKYCGKMEKLIEEGAANRFQTISIIVGDCVNEDKGLSSIYTSPGLENFLHNRLKLDDNSMLGLAKCEAYDAVSRRITDNIDAEQLIKELNDALGAAEAVLKPDSPPPQERDDDDEVMEDDANPITGCKDRIIGLLKSSTEAAGQTWDKDRLPWGTLTKYLTSISHVITGWPPSCPFPHETIKPKKSKKSGKEGNSQGIKDLGSKHGRVLLTALQGEQLKIIKADPVKISQNLIPVIATSTPTHDDPPTCRARSLYANGQVFTGQGAPKSMAATRIKRKKGSPEVIVLESDDTPKPSATTSKSSTTHSKLPPKSRQPYVEDASDSDTPIVTVKKKQPPAPPTKSTVSVGSSDSEDNKDVKRRKLASSDTEDDDNAIRSGDAIGSGDDYVDGPDGDESETGLRSSPRRPRRARVRAKGKGKEKEKEKTSIASDNLRNSKPPARPTTGAKSKVCATLMKPPQSTAAPSVATATDCTPSVASPSLAPSSTMKSTSNQKTATAASTATATKPTIQGPPHTAVRTAAPAPITRVDAPPVAPNTRPKPRPLARQPTAPAPAPTPAAPPTTMPNAVSPPPPPCGPGSQNIPPSSFERFVAPRTASNLPPAPEANDLQTNRSVTPLPSETSVNTANKAASDTMPVPVDDAVPIDDAMPIDDDIPVVDSIATDDPAVDNGVPGDGEDYFEQPIDDPYDAQMYHDYLPPPGNYMGYDMRYHYHAPPPHVMHTAPPPRHAPHAGFHPRYNAQHPRQGTQPPSSRVRPHYHQYQPVHPGVPNTAALHAPNMAAPRALNMAAPRAPNMAAPRAPNMPPPSRAPNMRAPYVPPSRASNMYAPNVPPLRAPAPNAVAGPSRLPNQSNARGQTFVPAFDDQQWNVQEERYDEQDANMLS